MVCPCKNTSGVPTKKTILVRNPHTLKPIQSDASSLSREDIRKGRTRRITEEIPENDEEVVTHRRYRKTRLPMGGFLTDTMRNRNR